jgi:hypothetical protein
MTVAPFTRIVNPGSHDATGDYVRAPVFAKIDWDGDRLSICGVVGPRPSGSAAGSCGQIVGHPITRFELRWDADLYARFTDVWRRWHLNDMRAGCEHQRAADEYLEPGGGHSVGDVCPVCDYSWGSAWLHEDVPDDVLEFLAALPISVRRPAWV